MESGRLPGAPLHGYLEKISEVMQGARPLNADPVRDHGAGSEDGRVYQGKVRGERMRILIL
jgi:hypothetical protein